MSHYDCYPLTLPLPIRVRPPVHSFAEVQRQEMPLPEGARIEEPWPTEKNDVHTLKVSSAGSSSEEFHEMQDLSLPEMKFLHDFWQEQWSLFRDAPANQNISEKRLREKFDGYIPINIKRFLTQNWNRKFAGQYVCGVNDPRTKRGSTELRKLTKEWGWLCEEIGFKPWPDAIYQEIERDDLENICMETREYPFTTEDLQWEAAVDHWVDSAETLVLPDHEQTSVFPDNIDGGVRLDPLRQGNHDCAMTAFNFNDFPASVIPPRPRIAVSEAALEYYNGRKEVYARQIMMNERLQEGDPRLKVRVDACLLQEILEMEENGYATFDMVQMVRFLIHGVER